MSNITTLPDGCTKENVNISKDKCFVNLPLVESFLASRTLNKKYLITDLQDPEFIADEIAAGNLFILPTITEVSNNSSEGVQTSTTGYGRIQLTSAQVNMNYEYNIPEISSCTFAKLQKLNGVPITTFPISSNQIGGTLVELNGDIYLQGQNASIAVPESLMPRESNTELTKIPMFYFANKARINYFLKVDYDLLSINGLIDTSITATSPTTTNVVLTIKAGCQQEALSGLDSDDIVVKKAGSVVTTSSVTETAPGVYLATFTSAQTAGDYTVNLDGVISLSGELYAPTSADATFTIA